MLRQIHEACPLFRGYGSKLSLLHTCDHGGQRPGPAPSSLPTRPAGLAALSCTIIPTSSSFRLKIGDTTCVCNRDDRLAPPAAAAPACPPPPSRQCVPIANASACSAGSPGTARSARPRAPPPTPPSAQNGCPRRRGPAARQILGPMSRARRPPSPLPSGRGQPRPPRSSRRQTPPPPPAQTQKHISSPRR